MQAPFPTPAPIQPAAAMGSATAVVPPSIPLSPGASVAAAVLPPSIPAAPAAVPTKIDVLGAPATIGTDAKGVLYRDCFYHISS